MGDGSWASAADKTHTYRTWFDYVRVYQTAEQRATGVETVTANRATLDVYPGNRSVRLVAPTATKATIVDMLGRTVYSGVVQGNVDVTLEPGVYVIAGGKYIIK